MEQLIPIIIDPDCHHSIWFSPAMDGFLNEAKKKEKKLIEITPDSLTTLEKNSVVVLVTNSPRFLSDVQACIKQHNLRLLLMGSESIAADYGISNVSVERRKAACYLTQHICSAGARRIAFVGMRSGSFTDFLRVEGWCDALKLLGLKNDHFEEWRFDYHDNLKNTVNSFFESDISFDAAICSNDYCALEVIVQARERQIPVPQSLMVTGYGNTKLSVFSCPSITTVSSSMYEAGCASFQLYRYLEKNPQTLYASSAISWQFFFRESTREPTSACVYATPCIQPSTRRIPWDQPYHALKNLELMLRGLDVVDVHILCQIAQGHTNAQICENLFLSESALRYRMKRIYDRSGLNSRSELVWMMNRYLNGLTSNAIKLTPKEE